MTPTTIALLGRLAIDRGAGSARPAGLPGCRTELVFAYLVAEHGRMVSRDELADALWPDALPDPRAAGLRGVVTEVRRYLADGGMTRGWRYLRGCRRAARSRAASEAEREGSLLLVADARAWQ